MANLAATAFATVVTSMMNKNHSRQRRDVAMPDDETLQHAARKRSTIMARRSGRVSTILDNKETLG